MPSERDISIYAGDTYVHELRIRDSSNVAINISTRIYSGQLKLSHASNTAIANFSTQILSGANGIVQFSLTPAVTSNITPGTYYFDFQQLDGSIVTTLVTGKAVVQGQVTNGG